MFLNYLAVVFTETPETPSSSCRFEYCNVDTPSFFTKNRSDRDGVYYFGNLLPSTHSRVEEILKVLDGGLKDLGLEP